MSQMAQQCRHSKLRYPFALGVVAATVMWGTLLAPLLNFDFPMMFHLPAVMLTAWFAGFGPSVLSVVLLTALTPFLLPTHHAHAIQSTSDSVKLFIFIAFNLLVACFVAKQFHDAQDRLDKVNAELQQRVSKSQTLLTQLHEREQELKRTHERDEMAINAVAGVLYDWDFTTQRIERSSHLQLLLNLEASEIEPTLDWYLQRVHPEDLATLKRELELGLAKSERLSFEYRLKHKDGHWIHVWDLSLIQRDAEGNPLRIVGNVLDITERKRVERELSESEHRFRTMADTAPVLIWMAGVDKLCTFFNKPWFDFTGRTLEQEYGNGWAEGVHREDFDHCFNTYVAAFDARHPFEMEYRLRRHDGVYRWILDRGVPRFSADGTFLGYIGSCIDISDRKELENERQRLFELEKIARECAENNNQMKDQFLATLSHELRTPLTPMLGWSSLLARGACDAETTKHGIEVIERNTRMQMRLVDDLLDISRIISGKLRLNVRQMELIPVLEAAIENLRTAAQAKNITLHTEFPTHKEIIVGDPDRIQQIVWNLLSNAIKFSTPNSSVLLSLKRPHENELQIQVIDKGEGLDAAFFSRIFERFSQTDTSRIRATGGLGLGLSIARHLVELHGGVIKVQSEGKGKGATFTVLLPTALIANGRGSGGVGGAATALLGARMRSPIFKLQQVDVLLVEDDVDSLDFLKIAFQQCGASVRTANSAQGALDCIAAKVPSVMVSDIAMPYEDGYELMRKIRKLPPEKGGSIPAIALTAFVRSEDRCMALDCGFAYHFSKPVDVDELTSAVAALAFKSC